MYVLGDALTGDFLNRLTWDIIYVSPGVPQLALSDVLLDAHT